MNVPQTISVKIEQKFCGPPNSGNGGYVCGLIAEQIPEVASVTLRKPIPLEVDLTLEVGAHLVTLRNENELIAEGKTASLEMEVPSPPSYSSALEHRENYPDFRPEYFQTCFVCGPQRKVADGLRIFTAPKEGSDLVAAPWETFPGLFDARGKLGYPYYHAALDCPGAFALSKLTDKPMLLGRMTAKVVEEIWAGEQLIVIGWPLAKDGRKVYSGTAIFRADGQLKAFAKSVWIEI